MRRHAAIAALAAAAVLCLPAIAQAPVQIETTEDARAALDAARQQQRNARARGEKLERQAAASREAAAKARAETAALAARVQQAEAGVAAAEAALALANRERRKLDRRLAQRRTPLVQLTGALQSMSRRPLALSALQSGSLRDLVYTRALLDSTIPVVRQRTAALRRELDRARELESEARAALVQRRDSEAVLLQRRRQLVARAAQERLKAQQAAGGADREAQRALVLAEQALDLDQLVGQLEAAGSLRQQLAALPGPLMRPADPTAARPSAVPEPLPSETAPPSRYQLPVEGEIATGFGEIGPSGQRQAGIALLARERGQVIAPAHGRIVFAGPYRGYGRIVIVEHDNGWTSLVTGMGALDVAVGQTISAGSPIGRAPAAGGAIALELRQDGNPVNPLDYLG
ncbi:peptidoglycan DD-metalloendopeptidase family protein [Qipengyuania flava]|uniref:murein hydrolase activator EnvC family protein n=1 Tax=Qipengyuania flava TaxID=192812 RepID=UPI001ADAF666|nr:peptidoglycan DD-metalloendopeptidase family protein [Qipengyuania flava]MBO9504231.1 peptidoglycan DD-metalloendopeptidase family protein [Qipengyuania flava]